MPCCNSNARVIGEPYRLRLSRARPQLAFWACRVRPVATAGDSPRHCPLSWGITKPEPREIRAEVLSCIAPPCPSETPRPTPYFIPRNLTRPLYLNQQQHP